MNDFSPLFVHLIYRYKLIRIIFTQPTKREQINDQF